MPTSTPHHTGRNRSEHVVAMDRNGWSRSPECAPFRARAPLHATLSAWPPGFWLFNMIVKSKLQKLIGPALTVLVWGVIIGGAIYWHSSVEARNATSQQTDMRVKIAVAKQQYDSDTTSIRPTCEATSTNKTGILLFQCNLIYETENPLYQLPGIPHSYPTSDDILNPDLPSICQFPIYQLTQFEISSCLNPPPPPL